MAMTVRFEDREFSLDFEAMTLKQAVHLKKHLGLNFRDMIAGLKDLDPESLVGIYWLMHDQNGKRKDINNIDFAVFPFFNAIATALTEESENPTQSPQSESSEANPPK